MVIYFIVGKLDKPPTYIYHSQISCNNDVSSTHRNDLEYNSTAMVAWEDVIYIPATDTTTPSLN